MLVGWVSDERDVALADVVVEFDRDGDTQAVARSTARGRLAADLDRGTYRATLRKDGFGPKASLLDVGPGRPPVRLRLLSDRLTGFMWPKWVRAGERSQPRFHATEGFGLSLWRYGLEKTFVRQLGWVDEHGPNAAMQITPDGDYTQTGVDWNRVGYGRNPHLSELVEAPLRSSLYYVHARSDTGAFFAAPWVVAPVAPSAPIAVLASTNTWNAYNNFGGRSNYINTIGLPAEPIVNARQDLSRYGGGESLGEWGHPNDAYPPLSFERPEPFNHVPAETQVTDAIDGRQANHLAPAEWRLLAWLEREGFAYDLYADAQLDDGTLDLAAYRVLVLSTHPEYWTRRMFERAADWVAGGGRLTYLGGNGVNCEVEIEDGRMRARTELRSTGGALGMADENDPSIWYDSRFSRTVGPEAALLGVATTDAGIMTAAPYRVTHAEHWIFEGTGLRDGDTFGERSLHQRCPGGASGHETDKMSASSPPGALLLAKGINPDEGGAEIVYHENSMGGRVFSVGSITWSSSILVDEAVSRITRNVLQRLRA